MQWLLAAMAVFSMTALAADVTGTWKGTAETPNGNIERTFVFKVDGEKLTGETTSNLMGKSTIEDGRIAGGKLSFTIRVKFQDNELKVKYTGQVTGDEILFKVELPNAGNTLEYKAKKVS